MSSTYRRLLEPTGLGPNEKQRLEEAFDAGAHGTLELQGRILKTGSGGNLKLQHAAVNKEDAYLDLANTSWDLTTAGGYISISSFLRYIRWVADGGVAGAPVAMIDIIAKD